MKRHERSKRHQDIRHYEQDKETKQEPEPKNIEKEKEQVRKQQTIDYINETFSSFIPRTRSISTTHKKLQPITTA